jgi:ABC-2 type transport system permease protein
MTREDDLRNSEKKMNPLLAAKQIIILSHVFGTIWILKVPTSMLFQAATPFSLLFVLFVVSGGQLLENAIAGAMIMAMIGVGMALGGDLAAYRLEFKLQDVFIASPVSSLAYMMGNALAQLTYSAPSLIVLGVLVVMFSDLAWFYVIPPLLATIFITWASMSALSFLINSRVQHERTTTHLTEALNIAIAVLPPVFYPIQTLPVVLQYLAYIVPTTQASLMVQSMMGLPTPAEWSLAIGFAVLTAYLVGFLLLTKSKGMWRES